jgi:hypothetical protein
LRSRSALADRNPGLPQPRSGPTVFGRLTFQDCDLTVGLALVSAVVCTSELVFDATIQGMFLAYDDLPANAALN